VSVKELLSKLGMGMRIAVEGRDIVLKIDNFFLSRKMRTRSGEV
jgi:hypothetical protein